jgi:prephenate dehydratase
MESFSTSDRTSIIFTLKHQVGALARALQVFQELGINVMHIELHSEKENETVSHSPTFLLSVVRSKNRTFN